MGEGSPRSPRGRRDGRGSTAIESRQGLGQGAEMSSGNFTRLFVEGAKAKLWFDAVMSESAGGRRRSRRRRLVDKAARHRGMRAKVDALMGARRHARTIRARSGRASRRDRQGRRVRTADRRGTLAAADALSR